jgi:quinol monooxygenase YgiN
MKTAFLEITMKVSSANRPKAGAIYAKYRQPFLSTVPGAGSKDLLIRDEDVQVLHSFDSRASAENYLASPLFAKDVVSELKPLLAAEPEIRIYERQ